MQTDQEKYRERKERRDAAAKAYRTARDGRSARDLIAAHDPSVQAYARTLHSPYGCIVEREDLVSVGRYAIIQAAETWDESRAEWGAHAYCTMRNAMVDALRHGDAISRTHRKKGDMTMESIDRPDENGYTAKDRIVDETAVTESVERTSMRLAVRARISALPVDQRTLISLRYRHGMWLKEIGALLGITESAVSLRLKKILAGMRSQACGIA